jgi:hypothetical protein
MSQRHISHFERISLRLGIFRDIQKRKLSHEFPLKRGDPNFAPRHSFHFDENRRYQ